MKKLRIIALISVFALISADSYGGWFQKWRSRAQQRQVQEVQQVEPAKPGDAVGAPLDGGLLAILAAAGAAYFGVRKKKKNAAE